MNFKFFVYSFLTMILALSCSKSVIETQQQIPLTNQLKSLTIGNNYYVANTGNDNNPGTATSPFLTIQKAANIVKPGDTVIVRDGIYTTTRDYIVTLISSGTATNNITFKAEHKGGAIFDGRGNATSYGIEFTNQSYVRMENFEFRNISKLAIIINGCSNITIKGNDIHDIGRVCSDSDLGLAGVYAAASSGIVIEDNKIYNIGRFANGENGCTTTNPNWQNHDHALYIDGVNGLVINNNIIYNCKAGWGIHLYSSTNRASSNVSILNNTWANKNEYRNGQILLCGSVSNLTIANNIFYLPTAAGISISQQPFSYSNCLITNNITYGGTINSGMASGFTFTKNLDNTDPKLISPATNDYRLQSTSPAINAGINVGLMDDYMGNMINGLPDIGAFESASMTTPPTVYYNVQKSASATKNSCGSGYTGSTVTYTVAASKYSSTISQTDADNMAIADLDANKQTYANANGTCTIIPQTVWYNTQKSASATKNSCGSGYTGSTVTYTVTANKYSSTVSQADADNKAIADLDANKQTYANTNGTCTIIPQTVWYNTQKSASATKNSCGSGYTGSTVTYTVTANKYSSTVSQADADNKAIADLDANKQTYANTNGTCTIIPQTVWYNTQKSASATKNSCGSGYIGSTVTYTVAANKYSSTVSQTDADNKAIADLDANKQTYANANGTCTIIPQTVWYNTQKSVSATKNSCGSGYTGSTVTYTVAANKYSSMVSQTDADNKAIADLDANKQTYANANGTCTIIPQTVWYNTQKSASATKNSCGSGYTGSTVTYTVAASKYSSTVSQTDADNKAIADLDANKQTYANANGTCTTLYYNTEMSASATKNSCGAGFLGSEVTYTVSAGKYSSEISQADADVKALEDLNNNKQAYANAHGDCKPTKLFQRRH